MVESWRRGLPERSIGAKTGDESLKFPGQSERMRLLTSSPTNEFTTADVYAFERELEKLHPDNSDKSRAGRHVRDNPVNKDTGQESDNSFKFCAMRDCYFIPVVANGNCHDPQPSTFNHQLFCNLWRLPQSNLYSPDAVSDRGI